MAVIWIFLAALGLYLVWKYWTVVIGAGYDPTPDEKVGPLLELAETGRRDVVYDLGCGDGRLIIAAARDYGARAVGIEADPIRWMMAVMNVRKAGLQDRVRVVFGNFFKVPIGEATVVSLFLYPPVNNRLRTKFKNELKKGSRIASYRWVIGGWKEKGTHPDDDFHLYFME